MMSLPKWIFIGAVALLGGVVLIAKMRNKEDPALGTSLPSALQFDITLDGSQESQVPIKTSPTTPSQAAAPTEAQPQWPTTPLSAALPEANRIDELFRTTGNTLPIIETISYKRKVPWLKNRVAWLVDYASHYETSRYFISRSLAGKPDYFYESYGEGSRFNVYRSDRPFSFYLLVDLSRSKLWLYYHDQTNDERVLLKTYPVGLGRSDPSTPSKLLTPLGKYSLGNKVAIFKPGTMGTYNREKTEMIRIFGTRWIPFEKELGNNTAPAKSFGLHGAPWTTDASGKLQELRDSVGKYESDGCIRLYTEDIEELFAIIASRPAVIEIVQDFGLAQLPGKESAATATAMR